jgi:hypothetical protein
MEEKYKKGNEKADQRKFASSKLKKSTLSSFLKRKSLKRLKIPQRKLFIGFLVAAKLIVFYIILKPHY